MRLPRRRTAILSTFLLAALLGGCFEPPVAERLLLEFLSDGAARATLMIDLGRGPRTSSRSAVRKRIATAERELTRRHRPMAGALRRAHPGHRRHQLPAHARRPAGVPPLGRAQRSGGLLAALRRRSGRLLLFAQRRPGEPRDLPQRRQPRDAQGARARAGGSRRVERRLLTSTWTGSSSSSGFSRPIRKEEKAAGKGCSG